MAQAPFRNSCSLRGHRHRGRTDEIEHQAGCLGGRRGCRCCSGRTGRYSRSMAPREGQFTESNCAVHDSCRCMAASRYIWLSAIGPGPCEVVMDGQRLSERKSEPNKQTHRSTVSLRKARRLHDSEVGPSASAPGLQNRAGAAAQDLSDAGRPWGGRGEIPRSGLSTRSPTFTDTIRLSRETYRSQ